MAVKFSQVPNVSYYDVKSAETQLKGRAFRTPLIENPVLNEIAGGRVFVKAECLQHTGSFKFRGAYNRISRLSDDDKKKGVVAFSSGNHAQGVALASRMLGVKATIVMPEDAPTIKMEGTKELGAEVVTYDRYTESREEISKGLCATLGATLVPSYDDIYIMGGQGTVGLEIADDLRMLRLAADQILINCGGGGLSSGVFTATNEVCPPHDKYVVEPALYNDTQMSLDQGKRVGVDPTQHSICDALLAPTPGKMTYQKLKELGVKGLTVTDEEAMSAIAFAAKNLKLVGEPGGVVSLAAVLERKVDLKDKVTVCIISGGNIDSETLAKAVNNYTK